MKTFQWPLRAFIIVGLLHLFSCTKSVDTATNDSVSIGASNDLTFPTTNDFSTCKLRRIYQSYGDGLATISGVFTYDHRGNPVSVLYDNDDFANDHFFIYDKQGRLREYRITGGIGQRRHFYGYDANNRILKDTLISAPGSMYEQRFVITLTYDNQGRIIKENIVNYWNAPGEGDDNPLKPTRNPSYTYDARGNLAVRDWKSSSYDNRISIFRTHPVFQFIHRNYSVNNSSTQAKYNSRGLPLSIIPGNDNFFNLENVTKAIYDCQ